MKSLLFVLFSVVAIAQTAIPYPQAGQSWQQPLGYVPSTNSTITNLDSLVGHVHLDNRSASSVTVTFTDNSTNCSGAPCHPWPAVSIAANTVYEADMGGILFTGGMIWSANTGSAVEGWVKGTYTIIPLVMNAPDKSRHRAPAIAGFLKMFSRQQPASLGHRLCTAPPSTDTFTCPAFVQ